MTPENDISKLLESWTRSQQQLWSGWMETLRKPGGAAGMQETWQQGLEAWRAAVEQTLDAQSKAMTAWAEQLGQVGGASPQARQWADAGVQLVEQWRAAQRGLWEQWFALMGKSLESGAKPGADQIGQLMGGWEQAARQMQQLQDAWAAALAPRKK